MYGMPTASSRAENSAQVSSCQLMILYQKTLPGFNKILVDTMRSGANVIKLSITTFPRFYPWQAFQAYSSKHSSLLWIGHKKFYNIGPWFINNIFIEINLNITTTLDGVKYIMCV